MSRDTWAIVLAGGDGERLRAIATDARGTCVPKQFLSFGRRQSLLRTTVDRARSFVEASCVVPVVAASHERWWRRELDAASLSNVVVQPRNAGTAAGLLLPLLHVLQSDPGAMVVVLPSDHHVADEAAFARALQQLVGAAREDTSRVVLLGMEAESPETQYGWIVPSPLRDGVTHAVEGFFEKPALVDAKALLGRGGLWSTFVLAGSGAAIKELFELATPALVQRFLGALATCDAREPEHLRLFYEGIEPVDFSRQVLQKPACRGRLRVMPARSCGWSDLGTPERIAKAFGKQAIEPLTARVDANRAV